MGLREADTSPAVRTLRVLLIEDSPDDATLVIKQLQRAGYEPQIERIETAADMRAALARRTWDIVLSDYELPRFGGLNALTVLHESGLDLPFIVVSGAIGEDTAVAAMKAGAHDYLMKDRLARLGPAIERELREAEMRRDRRRAEIELQEGMKVSTALARVGQELIQHFDTSDLLVRLCQVTAEVLKCDWSHTIFWQPEEQEFKAIAASGMTDEDWEVARLVTFSRNRLDSWLSRLAHDNVAHGEPILFAPARPPQDVAQLGIALRRGETLIGIQLGTRHGRQRPFDDTERRIGRGIAQFASLILEHARVRHELELSNNLKSDFVATMSHELRTPLNIIVGYNALLLDKEFGPTTPEQTDALSRIDRSARELLDLINATLDFGRLEKERVPLTIKRIQLAEVLEEVDRDVRGWQVDKPSVQLVWDIARAMPELRTDPIKLRVILRNLISNSMKFTMTGTVTVSARRHRGGVEISVTDTGVGIAPETLPIIFEAFRQGDASMTRRFGGVGLGLYIVRRLVELLGGSVRVESQVGAGSTFSVRLPREAPNAMLTTG